MRISHYFVGSLLGVYSAIASGLPAAENIEEVRGLHAELRIVRDREGVPHVRAQTERDALFGLGYVHAQDRLWQLEYLRRLGSGRLSEVLGPPALPGDKLFRTLGVVQSAEATWERYGPRQRRLLSAYVHGLNAGRRRLRECGLPMEFLLLNVDPEPWRPVDVLVNAKVLGWSVDQNWTQELLRLQITQKVGPARADQLMPAYPSNGPIIMPEADSATLARTNFQPLIGIDPRALAGLIALDRTFTEQTGLGGQGFGSNNQVLSAAHTTTGGPILASDPHLPAQIPSLFYSVHLSGGDLNVVGASAVGLPGIMMGHNGHVAWGWTNANADVQDFYVERILDGKDAEYNGAREPLQFRREIIKVKGGADVDLTVRSSRHGPLVSDLIDPHGPALALRWAALDADDDVGVTAYLYANKAQSWQQFTGAFRHWKAHPQNVVYGDAEGNIGYFMPGTIPRRAAGDGSAPVPGWTSQFEWNGYVPFDELPSSYNPRQGYLASSNNKIAPDSYRYKLSNSFAAPYRATRVLELLNAKGRHSLSDLETLQADVLAVHARELLPLLADARPANANDRNALELLRGWDLRVSAESAAAAVFEAWYIQLAESLFRDELGDALWQSYSDQLHLVSMAMASAVQTDSDWCDDTRTSARETCSATALAAFRLALTRMGTVQGTEDVAAWQWGKAHRTVFFHQPFDGDALLAGMFNRVVPNGGDKHTVNVASNPRWEEYDQRHIALYRQIIDLNDLSCSRWIAAPGQSGVIQSVHYDDLIDPWRRVEYRPMLFTEQAVDEQATEHLVLRP